MGNESLLLEWYERARMDIATARFMQNYRPVPIEIICYHCQQAGEKVLKGLLAFKDQEVPRTHRLDVILAQLNEPALSCLADACDELSPFATITRYPSAIQLTDDDMQLALAALDEILEQARVFGYPVEN